GWMSFERERPPTRRDSRSAAHERNTTTNHVRRASQAAFAGAAALVATFAGIAASSTHSARKTVRRVTVTKPRKTSAVAVPSVKPPPLQPTGESAPPPAPPAA